MPCTAPAFTTSASRPSSSHHFSRTPRGPYGAARNEACGGPLARSPCCHSDVTLLARVPAHHRCPGARLSVGGLSRRAWDLVAMLREDFVHMVASDASREGSRDHHGSLSRELEPA